MQPSPPLPEPGLWAGGATTDLTPPASVFLFGYPHVPRMSTGVHDRLEGSALFLRHGDGMALFIACDLIFVGKSFADSVRRTISERTGVPVRAIAVTATHTHSGPVTVDCVSNSADPVVPKAQAQYLSWAAARLAEAGCAAVSEAMPAEVGLAVAVAAGVGTNRHDPSGPADPDVPVLMVRARENHRPLACMVEYAMHPTVLHEDSTLISADFPHFTREYLRTERLLPPGCPVLYHNGASGNQSPRHVTRANTFAEARRLGELLGVAVAAVIPAVVYRSNLELQARHGFVNLQPRILPSLDEAQRCARDASSRFQTLRADSAPRTAIRAAECDWFGAEETVALARAATDGRLEAAIQNCSPAEIQAIAVGPWNFVFWPGEFFVEYALAVKARRPHTFVVTMANGELQGYIVTPEAAERRVYEATNALFSPENGRSVVEATIALLDSLEPSMVRP